MMLWHAKAMAHVAVYQTSNPSVTYPRSALNVPNANADDWEPVPKTQDETDIGDDGNCGCDADVEVENAAD